LTDDSWKNISDLLIERQYIKQVKENTYIVIDTNLPMPNYFIQTMKPLFDKYFSGRDNNNAEMARIGWDTIRKIDKFKIYPADDLKIYEICMNGKVIKMEGKEIMDYEIFILKLFETFGIMLPVYKTLKNDWAQLVTYWNQTYGETIETHHENISMNTEAVDAVVSYVGHAVISDDYIVKDGFITYKNGMLYVPVKNIKRLLKREEINITIRKLGYLMKDYLISGSVPLKIENKSERFWKLNPKKFDVKLGSEVKIEKEPDEEDPDETQTDLDGAAKTTDLPATATQTIPVPIVVEINKSKDNVQDEEDETLE
jgi:hypothetical protein